MMDHVAQVSLLIDGQHKSHTILQHVLTLTNALSHTQSLTLTYTLIKFCHYILCLLDSGQH